MFTSNGSTPDVHIYGFEILTAFGCGIAIQIGYTVATVKVKPHDIPSAISLQNVSQIGSSVIALAISGQVFQSAAFANLSEVLAGRGLSDAEVRSAVAGAQSTVLSSLNDQMRALAVEAITKAMSKVYILVLVAGATMFMSSLLMRREKLFA